MAQLYQYRPDARPQHDRSGDCPIDPTELCGHCNVSSSSLARTISPRGAAAGGACSAAGAAAAGAAWLCAGALRNPARRTGSAPLRFASHTSVPENQPPLNDLDLAPRPAAALRPDLDHVHDVVRLQPWRRPSRPSGPSHQASAPRKQPKTPPDPPAP